MNKNGMFLSLLVAASVCQGTVVLSLGDSEGNPNAAIVQPGSTFEIIASVDTPELLTSGQFKLYDLDQTGIFTLESIAIASSWSSNPLYVFDPSLQALDASNGFVTNYFGTLSRSEGGAGSGEMVTLLISVDSSAVKGTYRLNTGDLIFGNTFFEQVISISGPAYNVSVTPLPETLLLFIIGGGLTSLRRRCSR